MFSMLVSRSVFPFRIPSIHDVNSCLCFLVIAHSALQAATSLAQSRKEFKAVASWGGCGLEIANHDVTPELTTYILIDITHNQ